MVSCIIAVTGPTSAGKTYFSSLLLKRAISRGISCCRISTDEFYKDLSGLPFEERTKVNYDDPNSIASDEFVKTIDTLAKNQPVNIPIYDFSTHTRTGKSRTVQPTDLIIVEGIFSLAFEEVQALYTMAIYIDLDPDLRLIRRVNRDLVERGRSLDSVFNQYVSTVRPTQQQYVTSDRNKADVILMGNRDHQTLIEMILSFIESKKDEKS